MVASPAGVVVCTESLRKDLQREVNRMCTARENEEEIDRLFVENQDKSLSHTRKEKQLEALVSGQGRVALCVEKPGSL